MYIFDLVEVFLGVLVGHVGGTDVELEVWAIVLKIVVVGKFYRREVFVCVCVCVCVCVGGGGGGGGGGLSIVREVE